MKIFTKVAISTIFAVILLFSTNQSTQAQDVNFYYRAQILEITTTNIKLKILNNELKDQIINVDTQTLNSNINLQKESEVIVIKTISPTGSTFYISDNYRITPLIFMALIFIAIAVYFARIKGITSLIGLLLSIAVITFFMIPLIIQGFNPLLVTLASLSIIAVSSIYLAHGISTKTTLALVSIIITMAFATAFAVFAVNITQLRGLGTEEAFFIQINPNLTINLKGLLLGGIIMGALGVLDDITTAQTATVYELKKANKNLTFEDLYKRGTSVGIEHITSLINTLFLAYAGASLPLFLLFNINSTQPLWVILNSEFIVEEIVRTLVGSTALILAVPISTLLASYYFSKQD